MHVVAASIPALCFNTQLIFITAYLCDPLASVANGDISYIPDTTSPYAFGTIALYSCGTGYLRSGSPVQTCLGQGSNTTGFWDSSPPACIGTHCTSLLSLNQSMQ